MDTDNTVADIISLDFWAVTFTYFDTWAVDVFDFETQNKLTSAFSLHITTNHLTVWNRAVLNYDTIVGFSTSENTSSAELLKSTVRNVKICLNSNYTCIMISFISEKSAIVAI